MGLRYHRIIASAVRKVMSSHSSPVEVKIVQYHELVPELLVANGFRHLMIDHRRPHAARDANGIAPQLARNSAYTGREA